MTIKNALIGARHRLENKLIDSATLDAEILLSFILGWPREKLLANFDKKLTAGQNRKFEVLLDRRLKYEPIAYIIGQKEFYGLNFKINNKVLIPRPETEMLVEEALKQILRLRLNGDDEPAPSVAEGLRMTIRNHANLHLATKDQKSLILDVGTGSGCIALALKKNLPQASVVALDAFTDALNLAKNNACRLGLKIRFIKGDLLDSVKNEVLSGAIIVANLPYLDKAEIKNFTVAEKKGLSYEPSSALYAGRHGLSAYRKMFQQIVDRDVQPKIILAEIGSYYFRDFLKLAKKYFPQSKIEIKKDLAGRPRILIIEF